MTRAMRSHRCPRLVFLLALAALFAPTAWADTYDDATLVRITITDPLQVKVLHEMRVDIVGTQKGAVKALLREGELKRLAERGFAVEILYAEMQQDRERWAEAARAEPGKLASSYYTASKFNTQNPAAGTLMAHLLAQRNAHPAITRLYNLGPSQDGAYDIIAMKITRNPDALEAEPKIRIYGNIHGDEKGGVMVACDVLDWILAGYAEAPQDPTAKRLVDETEMWFIPMGNPYGNANNTRYNSRGVDLNRNFWGPVGSDAPPAWSEKETQAIRDLTETATADRPKKRFAVSLSFHEGEVCFNSIWNYTTNAPSDEPIFWSSRTGGTGCGAQTIPNCPTLAPHGLAQAYKDGNTTPGFWYTEGYDWYGTRGDTNDWAYGAWTQLDTTIELNEQKTPPASQINTYCLQHRQAVLNYMMKVFQGIHGVMVDAQTNAPLDGTVAVTATAIATYPVPRDFQAVYTDPVAGDFHRVLQPGTYTMTCSAPGYAPTVVPGLVVAADTKTIADCRMSRTGLEYDSSSFTDSCSGGGAGNGDGVLDAGEDATLRVTLRNIGSAAATGVTATIGSTFSGVTIDDGTAAFTDVPGAGTGQSLDPHFRIRVGPEVPCGTAIPFTLHMTSAQGSWDDTFTVPVGDATPATPQTLLSEGFDGATFPPAGWNQVDTAGSTGNWARSTGTVHPTGGGTHAGAGLAYFNSYTAQSGNNTRLYRLTGLSIPAEAASAAVTFWMYHDAGYSGSNDRVQVQVSTDGTTWTDAGAAVARYDGSTGWKQHSVPIDAYIGQSGVRIAFHGITAYGNDCHLDDVAVTWTPVPSCAMRTCEALAVPAEVAPGDTPATSLRFTDHDTATWPAGLRASSYTLYRGVPAGLPALLDAGADSCVRYTGAATAAVVPEPPSAGSFFWFLVTGSNTAGEGPAGAATAGPRTVNATGLCP